MRLDLGQGPFLWMRDTGTGAVDTGLDHFEAPVSATVGYTFFPKSGASPYVRAGVVHHIVSGDYVEGSESGLLGAIGVEFMRQRVASILLELTFDKSRVEFDRYQRTGSVVRRSTEKINTYDTVISIIAKF